MRIIAGTFRSRALEAPPGLATRPTSDRLRETLFNVLAPRIAGAKFLDLYAGSGAVGIEAISRGAAQAAFVERAPAAQKVLRANLTRLGLTAGFRIHAGSVSSFLRKPQAGMEPFDIVFLDPPYDAAEEYAAALGLLGGSSVELLAPSAVVIAEHRRKERLAEEYGALKRSRLLEQGDAALSFYVRETAAEADWRTKLQWGGKKVRMPGVDRKLWAQGVLAAMFLCATALPAQTEFPWEIGPFTRPAEGNPVIVPRPDSSFVDPILKTSVHWEALHTFNPAAIVRDGKVYVLYRAEDDSGAMEIGGHTSRLGLAESDDGIHFTRRAEPVFFPANDTEKAREWPGGVEDPRIVESEDGTYVLTYTQWNRQTYSVGIATSTDLLHWTKYGPAFLHEAGDKYDALKYKSAGIVTRLDPAKGRLIAAQIDGYYWMYWGEGSVHVARSPDLIHWTPVEDGSGAPFALLGPRPKHFDSTFPETGPPPVLTSAGIVVLYNGKNAEGKAGDRTLGANAYAVGEALFQDYNPVRIVARAEHPVLKPEMPYEKTGQYLAGTTFAEGLVVFHGHWFLYYGCADSVVGVVTAPVQ